MSQPPLRFVHASDLHLEQPLSGVAEVPAHLHDVFLEAPQEAASKVFDTALTEAADGLLLAGDVVNFDLAGPRAIVFLREQFQRLADRGIPVFWACGTSDPVDSWPASVALPENVHIFPVGQVADLELRRQGDDSGEVIARIQGISRSPGAPLDDSGFYRDAHGLFTVGIAYGTSASPGTEGDRVHYMALGGRHQRRTVDQSPGIAHYSGSPQGRNPTETGRCGCTIVAVDDAGHVSTRFVATDSICWITEVVEITAGTDEDALLSQMESRISKLRTKHHGMPLLVTWEIKGRGQVLNHIRSGGISDQMVSALRKKYGAESPSIWTVAVESEALLDVPQEWVDEETIMGDMLREFHDLEADTSIPLALDEFLPRGLGEADWADLVAVPDAERADLLGAASKMAVDLLDGEEELTECDEN